MQVGRLLSRATVGTLTILLTVLCFPFFSLLPFIFDFPLRLTTTTAI
jgi:hypothetical protein